MKLFSEKQTSNRSLSFENLKSEFKMGFGLVCMAVVTLVSPAMAQQPAKSSAPPREASPPPAGRVSERSSSNILVATDVDYKIGVGDVLEVQIEDAPELSGSFRVTTGGTFLMHYLGRITAKNKTPEELAKFITDGLRERYIYDPRVNVTVKQYNSRSFFIQGAVNSAGVYQIEGKPTLLELLTLAGGLQQNHGSTAFIIRKVKPREADGEAATIQPVAEKEVKNPADAADGSSQPADAPDAAAMYTMQKVSINGLLQGRFEQNMFLEPGDIVNVPATEVFFVGGEVKSPGSFPLKEGTTLRQALSLAQGINLNATGRGIIFRENREGGKREEIQIDLAGVMSGKKEDMPIYSNDIIMVPDSRMKKIVYPVLSAFALSAVIAPIR